MITLSPSTSLDQESLPRSTIVETKDKFDSFLKTALREPTSKNILKNKIHKNLKLISDDIPEEERIMNESVSENREFILNKFFENSFESSTRNPKSKPIPKPRTKIPDKSHESKSLSPPESHETFKVISPKVISMAPESILASPLNYKETKKLNTSLSLASRGETFRVKHAKTLKSAHEIFPNETRHIFSTENSNDKIEKHENFSKGEDDILNREIVNDEKLISELKLETTKFSEMNNSKEHKSDNSIIDTLNDKFPDKKPYDIVHLIIHKTDKLLLNSLVVHPVVKIHIVDINTGNYYSKKHRERSIMYYYDSNLHYIPPIMTHPFNLQEQRSLIPSWEETILINEEFNYIVTENENLMIFFELLDFMSLPALNEHSKGWHKIAFAFLKMGIPNSINLGEVIRLQLYYNTSSKKDDPQKCCVWETWHKKKFCKYPSTLYISFHKIKCGERTLTGLRSIDAMQQEIGTENVRKIDNINKAQRKNIPSLLQMEKKLEGNNIDDSTQLPNKCLAQFPTEEGCFTVKFSHNGLFLACALKIDKMYSIIIFSVVSFEEICFFPGHQGIIYSINWSPDDSLLTAASADGSVSVWDVLKMSFLQILPHPYFVYTSDVNQNFIATGCYDAVVRLWQNDNVVANFGLYQRLKGHTGYVTCVLFKSDQKSLLSSDSTGLILEWNLDFNTWGLYRRISITDLKGTLF
ncbi:hypothetical protein WA026_020273 [Henosepilachna vigintioctopunctata]|uniref:Uncharacterized protein n=1 Tax=Henosepilachna vigintioctopunctata TaxID=420089 RepID=A0AAW1TN37_9CUCU